MLAPVTALFATMIVSLSDDSRVRGGRDLVSDGEGSEEEDHDAAREAGEAALQREADRKACRREHRDERGRLKSHRAERGDDGDGEHGVLGHRRHESGERLIELAMTERVPDTTPRPLAGDPSHDEDEEREHDPLQEGHVGLQGFGDRDGVHEADVAHPRMNPHYRA
jgi:hypothetical protein